MLQCETCGGPVAAGAVPWGPAKLRLCGFCKAQRVRVDHAHPIADPLHAAHARAQQPVDLGPADVPPQPYVCAGDWTGANVQVAAGTTRGLTLADLERATAELPDTTEDPVAFRAHPASLDQLRTALTDDRELQAPIERALVTGLRLHRDPSLDVGLFVPMTRREEREWLRGDEVQL